MNALATIDMDKLDEAFPPPRNPAKLSWPATLPLEIALRIATPKVICEQYGVSREEWLQLIAHPVFVAEVEAANEMLKREGMSFKMKAAMQADAYLETMYTLATDPTVSPVVRADLMKFTINAAGLNAGKDQGKTNINVGVGFSIKMDLSR